MTTYNVISADSHVVEPPNTWVDNIDPAYRERAPRLVRRGEDDVFWCEEVTLIGVGSSSAAGKKSSELRKGGRFETDVFRGAWDPDARLADMARDGVDAEVVYPTMALRMYQLKDKDLLNAILRAYNRWLSGYSGAHPDRIKGIGMVSLHDVAAATAELPEIRRLGLAGVMVALGPGDAESYGSGGYDPFWAKAQELDLPVSLHTLTDPTPRARSTVIASVLDSVDVQVTLGEMIVGGVFERFPKLRVISVEADAGWAPYFIERLDYVYDRRKALYATGLSGETAPSAFFRRNVWLTFMRDHSGVLGRDQIGVDRLLWSSDYPHGDSTWPNSQQMIESLFRGVPQEDRRRIVCANAQDLYEF
jgi:predicted TIM-barrel fold metal-dependent hydrolase